MAISLHTSGSWAASNATTQVVTLPTHSAGDMLIVRVGMKHATLPGNITIDQGFTQIDEHNNGTTASGNGTGDVEIAAFWKIAASASETNPTVTFHGSVAATPGCAVAASFSKGASEGWATPVGDSGSVAAATSYTATMASHIAAAGGDWLLGFVVTNDNTTLTVPTISQTGLTLAAVVESPATALSSATSNDISADGCYRSVTSGTSSAAAVFSGTNSVADVGAAMVIRLRVVANVDIPLIDSGSAIYAPVLSEDGTYFGEVMQDAPLGYWRLGEPSGSTAEEVWNKYDGTYQNAPTLGVTGALVNDSDDAVTLNGSDEFITVADNSVFDFTTGPLSIEAWVKFDGVGGTFGDSIWGKGTLQTFFLLNTSDVLEFRKADEGVILSGGTISDTNWHHVVVTYHNGVSGEIYLDGVAVGGAVTDRTFVANSTSVGIGSKFGTSATDTWHGSMDEVAVYNYVLSAARVLAHYQAGSTFRVTLPLIDGGSAIYAPTLTAKNTISLGLIDASPTIYALSLTAKNLITLGLIDAGSAIYAPSVGASADLISLGLIDAGPAIYGLSISGVNLLSLGLIDAGSAIYAPTLVPQNAVVLGLIDAGSAIYAIAVTGINTIGLGLIDSGSAIYSPTVISGPQSIGLPLIDGGAQIYLIDVTQTVRFTGDALDDIVWRTRFRRNISGLRPRG